MYGYESWTIKKAEQQRIDAFELWCWRRLLRIPEIKLVNPKGNQCWIFIGRTDAEAEAPVLWPPDVKSQLSGRDPDAGKDWRPEEKGTTEDEMARWHHRLKGHEFEQATGDSEGQGGLVCCSPWGPQESDTTQWLNNSNKARESWRYTGQVRQWLQNIQGRKDSVHSNNGSILPTKLELCKHSSFYLQQC